MSVYRTQDRPCGNMVYLHPVDVTLSSTPVDLRSTFPHAILALPELGSLVLRNVVYFFPSEHQKHRIVVLHFHLAFRTTHLDN